MNFLKDLKSNIASDIALNIQLINTNTTTAGVIIDRKAFNSLTFIIASATLTDGTYTVLIEDGDNSSLTDAAAVSDDFLIGTEAAASFVATEDNVSKRIGYIGHKRYVRLSIVSAGTTSGGTVVAIALLGHPKKAPRPQDA